MSTDQNHEIVFIDKGVATLSPCDMPVIGDDDLLLRTRTSLISPGTERAFFLGLPNTPQIYPMPSGYCNIAEVIAVGSNVEGWQVGDRAASKARHRRYSAYPAANCLPVPPGLDDAYAPFFNLAAIAMQGVRKSRIELGECVAVIGAGLIGLFAMQLARINGALEVISIDLDDSRLDLARQVGADGTINPRNVDDLAAAVGSLCTQDGPAVVIEATGHPEAVPQAFDITQRYGRVVLLGSTRGETEMVNFYRDIHKKGLTILGAHESARPRVDTTSAWWTQYDEHKVCLRLIEQGRLIVEPFLTHRFHWQDALEGYELLKSWDKKALGILLEWT